MSGFVKLYSSILDSSVWAGEDSDTRIVWVTLLAMARPDGLVECRAPGVAARARVGVEKTRLALEKFAAPDPDSRSLEHDGRRIRHVDDGILILNFDKYRGQSASTQRVRRHRARSVPVTLGNAGNVPVTLGNAGNVPVTLGNAGNVPVTPVTLRNGPEAEAEAEADPKPNGQVSDPKTDQVARVREEQETDQTTGLSPLEIPEPPGVCGGAIPPCVALPRDAREPPPARMYQFPADWRPGDGTPEQRKRIVDAARQLGLTQDQVSEAWTKHAHRAFERGFVDPHRQFLLVLGWHARDVHAAPQAVGGIHVPRMRPPPPAPASEHAKREAAYRQRRTEEPPPRRDDEPPSPVLAALAEQTGPVAPPPPKRAAARRRMTAEELEAELAKTAGAR